MVKKLSGTAGLRPQFARMVETLVNRARERGYTVSVVEGKRSAATQAKAYAVWRRTGRNLAGQKVPIIAPPNKSKHVTGEAVDLAASNAALSWMGKEWEAMGGIWGGRWKAREPWHFESGSRSSTTVARKGPVRRVTYRASAPNPKAALKLLKMVR